jgi:flagella synthesis protein FlgN
MSTLAGMLSREIDKISRFVTLLKIEQGALRSAQTNDLSRISKEKLELVGQLNLLGTERILLISGSSPAEDHLAMDSWLALHPEEKEPAALWNSLLFLAKEAKELHDLNMQLVGIHLQQTNNALAILTSREPGNTLYSSNGQSSPLTGSRIVDSA